MSIEIIGQTINGQTGTGDGGEIVVQPLVGYDEYDSSIDPTKWDTYTSAVGASITETNSAILIASSSKNSPYTSTAYITTKIDLSNSNWLYFNFLMSGIQTNGTTYARVEVSGNNGSSWSTIGNLSQSNATCAFSRAASVIGKNNKDGTISFWGNTNLNLGDTPSATINIVSIVLFRITSYSTQSSGYHDVYNTITLFPIYYQ